MPSRTPGPQCQDRNPVNINDGTLCRAESPKPGPSGWFSRFESTVKSEYDSAARVMDSGYERVKGTLQTQYQNASRYLKADYEGARCLYQAYLRSTELAPAAILEETGHELTSLLKGLLPGLLQMMAIVGATTFIGAGVGGVIGFFFGGVGAAPGVVVGADLGFDLGMAIMTWMGLAFLAVAIVQGFGELLGALRNGVEWAWAAGKLSGSDEEKQVERAAKEMARASGILVRLILEAIVAYLLKKAAMSSTRGAVSTVQAISKGGTQAAAEETVASLVGRLRASKLGGGFADWVESNWRDLVENPKLKPKLPAEDLGALSEPAKEEPGKSQQKKPAEKAPEELIAQRKAAAENFYRSKGWPKSKIAAHMKGIDFTKPVEVTTLQPGTQVAQWQKPGMLQGNYYAPPGTNPATLGIDTVGRTETMYVVDQPVEVLQSTAADVPDWNGSGTTFSGGSTQYFTTEGGSFSPL